MASFGTTHRTQHTAHSWGEGTIHSQNLSTIGDLPQFANTKLRLTTTNEKDNIQPGGIDGVTANLPWDRKNSHEWTAVNGVRQDLNKSLIRLSPENYITQPVFDRM